VVSADYRSLLAENKPTVLSTFDISDDAYHAYTQGMYLVTHGNGEWSGTASKLFKDYPIAVAAKTGTAQTDAGTNASDNGAFVCYAPYENPRIAIAVYGEKAGHGSSMAAVAKAILDAYFGLDNSGETLPGENEIS
jgi:penicillin-binding protein 2